MRLSTEKVSITIDAREALSIINALNKGTGNHMESPTPETKPAHDLRDLLMKNFNNTITGVHIPK